MSRKNCKKLLGVDETPVSIAVPDPIAVLLLFGVDELYAVLCKFHSTIIHSRISHIFHH